MPASRPEDAPLWKALRAGDAAALRMAINRGANPNAQGHSTLYGRTTALVEAAEAADPDALAVLLAHGARARPGRFEATPLLALAIALPHHVETPDDHLRCLDQLLARRPNLEVEGGDASRSRGNAVFHYLRQWEQPLARQAFERVLAAAARQKKPFSQDFSASVLLAAFNFATPDAFDRLVGAGVDPQATGIYAAGLAYRQYSRSTHPDFPDDAQTARRWWDMLARHDVPPGAGGAGIDVDTDQRAQACLQATQARQRQAALSTALPASPAPRGRVRI